MKECICFKWSLLFCFELFFAYATKRTNIIIGKVLECNTGFNTLLGITNLRIVYPLTYGTNIFFHNLSVLIFNNNGKYFVQC